MSLNRRHSFSNWSDKSLPSMTTDHDPQPIGPTNPQQSHLKRRSRSKSTVEGISAENNGDPAKIEQESSNQGDLTQYSIDSFLGNHTPRGGSIGIQSSTPSEIGLEYHSSKSSVFGFGNIDGIVDSVSGNQGAWVKELDFNEMLKTWGAVLIVFVPSLLKVLEHRMITRQDNNGGKLQNGTVCGNSLSGFSYDGTLGSMNSGSSGINRESLELSSLSIDLFSISIISWIVKFLHDWPNMWNSQIKKLIERSELLLKEEGDKHTNDKDKDESHDTRDSEKNSNGNRISSKDIELLKKLQTQYYISFLLCFLTPFLSALILRQFNVMHSEEYHALYSVSKDINIVLFTDMNVLIFLMFEQVLNLINFCDGMRKYTIAMEMDLADLIARGIEFEKNSDIDGGDQCYENKDERDETLGRVDELEKKVSKQNEIIEENYSKLVTLLNDTNNQICSKLNLKIINKFNKLEKELLSLQKKPMNEISNKLRTNNNSSLNPIVELPEEQSSSSSSSNLRMPLTKSTQIVPIDNHTDEERFNGTEMLRFFDKPMKSLLPSFKITTGSSSSSSTDLTAASNSTTAIDSLEAPESTSEALIIDDYSDLEEHKYYLINDSNGNGSSMVAFEGNQHGAVALGKPRKNILENGDNDIEDVENVADISGGYHGTLQFLKFTPFRTFKRSNEPLAVTRPLNGELKKNEVLELRSLQMIPKLGIRIMIMILFKIPILMHLMLWDLFLIKPIRAGIIMIGKLTGVNLFDDD